MISIRKLNRTEAGMPVLRGIDLEVDAGEVVVLVGRHSGRSRLLALLAGLLLPDEGEVEIGGKPLSRALLRDLDRLRSRIGYLAQDATLPCDRTAGEILELTIGHAADRNPLHEPVRISFALDLAGLDARILRNLCGELCPADRARLCLARTLLHGPDILLLDSPLARVPSADRPIVVEAINRARDGLGATVVAALDEPSAIPPLADRVVVMERGSIVFDGNVPAFLRAPILLDWPASLHVS